MKEYAKHDYHAETDKNGDEKVGSSCRPYSATVGAIGVATSIQGTFRNVGVASTHNGPLNRPPKDRMKVHTSPNWYNSYCQYTDSC